VELADGVIEAAQGRRARAPRPPMHGAITHDTVRAFCDFFRQLQNTPNAFFNKNSGLKS
jgi:hypothetical protein